MKELMRIFILIFCFITMFLYMFAAVPKWLMWIAFIASIINFVIFAYEEKLYKTDWEEVNENEKNANDR